ncbi:putative neutral ceramidase C [Uloborus diversus]|uniref:putative neutral ceramidase C n=1 Tax=Uloborus diversus TaxID=327109 RepID=UPI00240A2775|nr:putative neutral ceramidase C [Uloborus diversus]
MALKNFILKSVVICLIIVISHICAADRDPELYDIGVGIADVTGPAAEINMMGYAKMAQLTKGIHIRQYSRAFIISDNSSRVVIITIDAGMVSHIVKAEVVKALREKFGDTYTDDNVLITATHTHATPGGYLQYLLYLIPSQGFIRQTFFSLVQGIVKSVERANNNLQPGYVYWNVGQVNNASINRSPTAYLNNPPEERERFGSNVDKTMFLVKFTDANEKPLGMINWFAVHPTSMNSSNHLISGDNKGAASLMFEEAVNGYSALPGKGPFVAAFAQANAGDVSPNILGSHCPSDPNDVCDIETSTCRSGKERCIALGPGKDMFESTWIIGRRQYDTAMALFESATERLRGPVLFIHQYIDMSNIELSDNETIRRTTCKPAMGYSFAAGTIDCPGEFDFLQGTTKSSTLWNIVIDFIRRPSKALKQCHFPKPILLATGEMSLPYKWQPDVVPTQILKIGNLAILGIPAEITTMAGRRLRSSVKKVFDESNYHSDDTNVVIASLSNAYSSYVSTYEEYQVQRYEGASTLYGPHTLEAYIHQYEMLADNMLLRNDIGHDLQPVDLLNQQMSFKLNVMFDGIRRGKNFGDVAEDAQPEYTVGSTVKVSFISGHPRNDMMLERTFLTVERWNNATEHWDVIATDGNWETKYYWQRKNTLIADSLSTITWDIPLTTKPGRYRIRHFGNSKNILQIIKPYIGSSREFNVVSS